MITYSEDNDEDQELELDEWIHLINRCLNEKSFRIYK